MNLLFNIFAASIVVPEPAKGSITKSPSLEPIVMRYDINLRGFTVGLLFSPCRFFSFLLGLGTINAGYVFCACSGNFFANHLSKSKYLEYEPVSRSTSPYLLVVTIALLRVSSLTKRLEGNLPSGLISFIIGVYFPYTLTLEKCTHSC